MALRSIIVAKKQGKNPSPPDFEATLAELEELIEKMEEGDISLEESLQSFERGIVLTRTCQEALKAAEQKVQILLEQNKQTEVQSFEDDSEDDN
jgi:exodeoxyribonuclease VII small subunit